MERELLAPHWRHEGGDSVFCSKEDEWDFSVGGKSGPEAVPVARNLLAVSDEKKGRYGYGC